MENKKYQKIVEKNTPKENKGKNLITAFITGGFLGLLANILLEAYAYYFHLPKCFNVYEALIHSKGYIFLSKV